MAAPGSDVPDPALMQELQARALAQAAAAAGLSPSAAMAAIPMLPNLQEPMPPMEPAPLALAEAEEVSAPP